MIKYLKTTHSLLEEAYKDMKRHHQYEKDRLKSFEVILPQVEIYLKNWNALPVRSPALDKYTVNHLQLAWNAQSCQAVILHIYLRENESIEDVKRWFRKQPNNKDFKLYKTTAFEELNTYDMIYTHKERASLYIRIWLKQSKVCYFEEDGTQPKYKLTCNKNEVPND